MSVQIASSTQYYESGTVQLQVTQVIAGTVIEPTISFGFQRTLVASDFPSNWDLVAPLGASLESAVGDELLVFVTESNGTYSIYPANNSVQAITRGLLVGKIVSLHRHDENSFWNPGSAIDVEIQVSETIYGWVGGTDVTLEFSKHLQAVGDNGQGGAHYGSSASMLNPFADGNDSISAFTTGLLDECRRGANHGKRFVIAFVNGKISGVEIASSQFLNTLQILDSQ